MYLLANPGVMKKTKAISSDYYTDSSGKKFIQIDFGIANYDDQIISCGWSITSDTDWRIISSNPSTTLYGDGTTRVTGWTLLFTGTTNPSGAGGIVGTAIYGRTVY